MSDRDDKIEITRGLLQDLVDISVGGMDWGSGFLDHEQTNSLVGAARLLGIDPLKVVQKNDLCTYYARLNDVPFAHDWGAWTPLTYPGARDEGYRYCKRCGVSERGKVVL